MMILSLILTKILNKNLFIRRYSSFKKLNDKILIIHNTFGGTKSFGLLRIPQTVSKSRFNVFMSYYLEWSQ